MKQQLQQMMISQRDNHKPYNRHNKQIYIKKLKEFEQKLSLFTLYNRDPSQQYYVVSSMFIKKWRQYCLNPQYLGVNNLSLNEDICNQQGQLLDELKYKEHYQIVTSGMYDLIKQFQGIEVNQKIILSDRKNVISLPIKKYSYICIKAQFTKRIQQINQKRQLQEKMIEITESEQITVQDFLYQILNQQNQKDDCQARVWKISRQKLELLKYKVFNAIHKTTITIQNNLLGHQLQQSQLLKDIEYKSQQIFIIQSKYIHKNWLIQSQKFIECGKQFKSKDFCEKTINKTDNSLIRFNFNMNSKRGKVGLKNIGNTCFFNSCLQCLSNTVPLTTYFINKFYQNNVNKNCNQSSDNKIVKAYANFIKQMWCQSNTYFQPRQLKLAMNSKNPMFINLVQHDSQELFLFLIDAIHEELNRANKKQMMKANQILTNQGEPNQLNFADNNKDYQHKKELNVKEQYKLSFKSWLNYNKSDQSIIMDLMTGQYQSQIICSTCKYSSMTFDPFRTLTLPLPQKQKQKQSLKKYYVIITGNAFSQRPRFWGYKIKEQKIEILIKQMLNDHDLNAKQTIVCLVKQNQIVYVDDCMKAASEKLQDEKMMVMAWQLPKQQLSLNKDQIIRITVQLCKAGFYSYSPHENIFYKFPILISKNADNAHDIYRRIFHILYNIPKQTSNRATNQFYQTFQKRMFKNKPFKLILKYQKIDASNHYKKQYKFNKQVQILQETDISMLLQGISQPFQLQVRFQDQFYDKFHLRLLRLLYNQKWKEQSEDKKPKNKESQVIQLEDCFKQLTKVEILSEGEQWFCPKCNKKKRSSKQMMIYKIPSILVIHLKRFKQNHKNKKMEKNHALVVFPLQFDISSYVIDKTSFKNYRQEAYKSKIIDPYQQKDLSQFYETFINNENTIYELYAINNHYGNLGGGHYTAFCKNGQRWYEYNDSKIKQISSDSICTNGAYMLFYKRQDK